MRVAVVDLGTNTCRLFLAEVGDAGNVMADARLTTVVRLGQNVDRTERLDPAAIARTRACLAGYAPRLEAYGRGFLDGVARDFALPSRVLGGEEEGALAFRGGTAELAGRANGPLVLTDIGGGSTEFAVGAAGLKPEFVLSLDIGVVRLTERFLHHDPPAAEELGRLTAYVGGAIADGVPATVRGAARGAVGVAGTYTTLVAHKLGLREYRSELVHGHLLGLADIDAAIAEFAGLTNEQRGRLPGIQRGREDVILAGALIAREACRAFGLAEVRCSEADILEGAALALAEGSLRSG